MALTKNKTRSSARNLRVPAVGQNSSARAQRSASASQAGTVQALQQREENQQDRIAQGVKSGALRAEQAAQLEKSQVRINNAVRNDLSRRSKSEEKSPRVAGGSFLRATVFSRAPSGGVDAMAVSP